MTESAGTALRVRECLLGFYWLENNLAEAGDYHLGDALAVADLKGFLREVHQQHLDLPAVVGVDGAGRVEYSQSAGNSIYRPVGTSTRQPGCNRMLSSKLARKSTPAACSDAYAGSSLPDSL